MKRILGLDLGSSSIGWAIIEEHSKEILSKENLYTKDKIIAIGSRIIPLSTDESKQFSNGQALTRNSERTQKRTQRKGYDRYQLRKALLLEKLSQLGMYNGSSLKLSKLQLWELRAKATNEQISLTELGRVLCHINQKRGYRTIKSDYGDKKQGAYVTQILERHKEINEQKITIGQFLYNGIKNNPAYRCKDRIFPRIAYMEEYDTIMNCQKQFYPETLTDDIIEHIRNYIIFHQRPLKSCKHLVNRCELERFEIKKGESTINCAPKVAPRTSPLFQVCKIWESINNLNIQNKVNDTLHITQEQKQAIFDFMNTNEKLKATDLKNILGIKSKDWQLGKAVNGNGLQGNTTYCAINKILKNHQEYKHLLQFNLIVNSLEVVNPETGEIFERKFIDSIFEKQPLYELWHALYSISNIEELHRTLKNKFKITKEEVINDLCRIDFVKAGYSNKSSRAIRKILPYLQDGIQYHEAKLMAGYNDVTPTKEQNEARQLAEKLLPIKKGELRQPVVEKILNQLVNLVNALMDEHGRFDEIRVELARELKQNKEERESTSKAINKNQKENERIANRIKEEYRLTPTRSRIQKYKMWEESEHICIYCGKTVSAKEFLLGSGVEVEHIIPRSVLFDDSFSNKVCSCRECNNDKNNRTAYDYMRTKSEGDFNAYIERIDDLFNKNKISKTKRKNLLLPSTELPTDFIERQLRESQYIAKKAKEILQTICYNVYSTSGSITDFIRHLWGWDEVLHTLNFNRYKNAGLTEMVEREINGKKIEVERIAGWTKRMDHRHHAVDALTIACTKQGYIQRINNLNSLKDVSFSSFSDDKQNKETRQRLTLLERYIKMQPHFSTAEVEQVVEGIAVSFKSGKRVASIGKRYIRKGGKRICVQRGIIIPRGALSEESVYGCIQNSETKKQEIVIKYKLASIGLKDVNFVVDKRIRDILRNRLQQFDGKPEKAFAEPIYDHQGREIRSVRCYTGLNSTVPVRYNEQNEPIAFVKPGNNHHVAIYEDENGKLQEHVVTFWHAVERKKYGIPTIITNTADVWDNVSNKMKMPQAFLNQLPPSASWKFKFSMQQNEMFILGMEEELYNDAMQKEDYATLSKYLYRVQKIAKGDYSFRHHLETSVDDNSSIAKSMGKMKRLSPKSLIENNPHKVHISIIGKITEI
ncbi:MAG: type II CRISPR RNA-guided endonuclease Cas9 [Paludibacteraceae bacterium]|nr:type II CRISPR RNA-guided endonuclease Cas9 [Paludibacteraceae bacterium]